MDTLQAGRQSYDLRRWEEACRLLAAADRDSPLGAEDLERLATAAYLVARDEDSETFRARAHQQFLDRGDREAAAKSAFWLGFGLLQRGAVAPASGWMGRAERLLAEPPLDCGVRGYLLIPAAIQRITQGDPAGGHAVFVEAAEIAVRFADRDLAALTCHGRGRALIRLGRVAEGVTLLDEAMAAVVAGDVSPIAAGDVYCSVLDACQEVFDLQRASQWTASIARWCAAQPDLVRYRGECLLARAEVVQLRGDWAAAEQDAQQACVLLSSAGGRPVAGAAFYRLGEIHRLRGEFTKAEASYRQANEYGRQPQPGLALLRLAQGQTELASASISHALAAARNRGVRARLLSAAVEIMVAAHDLANARSAAAELSDIADAVGARLLSGASAHATGSILLASADLAGASSSLQRAWETWRDLETPYEEALTRAAMAEVCDRLGDRDRRDIELDAARRVFTRLKAQPALARLAGEATNAGPARHGPLSPRETQVLRAIAAGKTNRAIADELFISEKTVARHVSNIFTKLDISTRSAATAYAYQQNLVRIPT